jgi:hypothetical protein
MSLTLCSSLCGQRPASVSASTSYVSKAAVRRELERFLEATRRGDGVAGAGEEERQLAEYVEGLLEELATDGRG